MMHYKFLIITTLIIFIKIQSLYALNRIESKSVNRQVTNKIYMSFGRSTVLIFPCNVVSFSDGPTQDIQGLLNERNSKMIEIWYTKNSPEPQELKVFCQEQNFVFDIMPSQTTHQSIFEVSMSYKSQNNEFRFIDTSKIKTSKHNFKVLKVVKSSK